MEIEFDAEKDRSNVAKHGISLARAADIEILSVLEDERIDYGERRFRAWGVIDGVAHCLVFTVRNDAVRAISLRRAHRKETERYGQKTQS